MHKTAKYLYIIGGCALAAEREPIRQIERIHVEKAGDSVNVISENCGQLTIARRSPACFLAGNQRILVAGGCSAPNEHTDSMEMLEISEIGEIRSIFLDEKLEIGASCSGFDWDTHSAGTVSLLILAK
ncbi:DUF1636 domain-containing protein [Caenorhabditis elegans]|uniref:DUF1636 domain-containing protein n=1 Tax=Caenorhabditis elegans TaxID=6239 RepID=Q1ZXR8_CAEEL|nr:DUF1636 domain-containing protein [Caenorhabditis elegans]CAJ85754.1 DUF1636 domain-containing protein [Caenorhabditis elegans]|eukprot:NP_001040698.1 Uncharacterized protein CELE_W09G3.1 [Caenorhabditis elegans]